MKDRSTGGVLAFIIAAPLVLICCGGQAALIGTAIFGAFGYLTGAKLVSIALLAAIGATAFLTARTFLRSQRHNNTAQKDIPSERQTS